jgi:hypothetical protein
MGNAIASEQFLATDCVKPGSTSTASPAESIHHRGSGGPRP